MLISGTELILRDLLGHVAQLAILIDVLLQVDVLVILVVCDHADHLFKGPNPLGVDGDLISLVGGLLLTLGKLLVQQSTRLLLRLNITLQVLVVFVVFWLYILINILNSLHEVIHQVVNLASQGVCFLLEKGELFIPKHHLLLYVLDD